MPRFVLASLLGFEAMPALGLAQDLSRYRAFQLGSDLPAVCAPAGLELAQAKVVQSRPALIQELVWRPQPPGASSHAESVDEVVFGFYDGALYRIAVNYDRHETEGLTAADFVEALSAAYGIAERTGAQPAPAIRSYGNQDTILARWQDAQYRFELIRSSYGPAYRLVGVLKRLEEPARAAILEAARLDLLEAPQRNAARLASEKDAEQDRLDKARLLNLPRFRP